MTHLSEGVSPLQIQTKSVDDLATLTSAAAGCNDVCLVILPTYVDPKLVQSVIDSLRQAAKGLGPEATLIVLGNSRDLVHVHMQLGEMLRYQLWISIKRETPLIAPDKSSLPNYHFGALVYTRYDGSLRHTNTRIKYTYCPVCDKTTKDYGGKKHTYNSYGTLISDVWRDIASDYAGDLSPLFQRFADLFGLSPYQKLLVLDGRYLQTEKQAAHHREPAPAYTIQPALTGLEYVSAEQGSRLLLGDCLEHLRNIPDNSVDFAFADPPYNLRKKYNSYTDDLEITEYFDWCDEWLSELIRVLRPGRTLAVLNIPLWAIRHFVFLERHLLFQNWIAWDALSYPVRMIMPAHYAILCFSKGTPRPLPGLSDPPEQFNVPHPSNTFQPLAPLAEGYCLRTSCVKDRQLRHVDDRGPLTDLWWDIHRLKHNTRRVDHPCQLPPQLMYRLISLFTEPGEIVIDSFNGAGTTTLAAHQLGRGYIGIELSEKYHAIALSRHGEIRQGLDPFRKVERELTEKNSPVERMPKRKYEVPKKTLQLEVRRVAQLLNRLPSRSEMIEYGRYPIRYYDDYFASWGEVCAAARHDGMTENRGSQSNGDGDTLVHQLALFNRGERDAKR